MGAGYNDRLVTDAGAMVALPFVAAGGAIDFKRGVAGAWTAPGSYNTLFERYASNSSNAVNDAVEIDFWGTKVALIVTKHNAAAIIDVYIDDTLAQSGIDCYSATTRCRQQVFFKDGLTPGQHTLKVVATGKNASSSGYRLWLEGILVEAAAGPGFIPQMQCVYIANSGVTLNTSTTVSGSWSNAGFWNNAAVSAGGTSTYITTYGARLRVLANVSAATEITVQHSPDGTNWYDGEVLSFTAAGTKTLVVDCCYYVRLKSSQAATITAGYIYLRG